ncbi:MAG: PKD domain-containing protein [Candidatus Nanopelagicales bacterium]
MGKRIITFLLPGLIIASSIFVVSWMSSAAAYPAENCVPDASGNEVCFEEDVTKGTITVETNPSVSSQGIKGVWYYNSTVDATSTSCNSWEANHQPDDCRQGGGILYELYYKPLDPKSNFNLVAYDSSWKRSQSGNRNAPVAYAGVGGIGSTEVYALNPNSVLAPQATAGNMDGITDKAAAKLLSKSASIENGKVLLKFSYKVRNLNSNLTQYQPDATAPDYPYWYQIDKEWIIEPGGAIYLSLNWTLLNSGQFSEFATRSQFTYEGQWDSFIKYAHSSNHSSTSNRLLGSSDLNQRTAECWNYLNLYHADWFALTGSDIAPTVRVTPVGGFDQNGSNNLASQVFPGGAVEEQCSCIGPNMGSHAVNWLAWWGGNPPPGSRYTSISAKVVDPATGNEVNRSWTDNYKIDMFEHSPVVDDQGNRLGPEISNLKIERISDTDARVTWDTDIPADSVVEGALGDLANSSSWTELNGKVSVETPGYVVEHSARITFQADDDDNYTIRVKSVDEAGKSAESSGHEYSHDTTPSVASVVRLSTSGAGEQANRASGYWFSTSDDGRYTAFLSRASNLIPGSNLDYFNLVFVKDNNLGGETKLASAGSINNRAPFISGNGRYVAFTTNAELTSDDENTSEDDPSKSSDVYVRDMKNDTIVLASSNSSGTGGNHSSERASLSSDGRYVVFVSRASNLTGTPNNQWRVYRKEITDPEGNLITNGQVKCASTSSSPEEVLGDWSSGVQGNDEVPPSLSSDGSRVAFQSAARNLVTGVSGENVFVKDFNTGATTNISGGNGNSNGYSSSISGDGRYVVFRSQQKLVSGDVNSSGDIYRRAVDDPAALELVTTGATNWSWRADISNDGKFVVFDSSDSFGLAEDVNGNIMDVFIKNMDTGAISLISKQLPEKAAGSVKGEGGRSMWPSISGNGSKIVFISLAPTLIHDDVNGTWDIFMANINTVPDITAGGDITVDEGGMATNSGTYADPDGDTIVFSATAGTVTNNGNGTWSWTMAAGDGPADSQTVTITANDQRGGISTSSFNLSVNNLAPNVGDINAILDPLPVGSPVSISADFADAGQMDTHTAIVNWGDGSPATVATVNEANGLGSASGSHVYDSAGVYRVTVSVTDNDGAESSSVFEYIVIYDVAAGYVTGGGWINSPIGAYIGNPTLSGKANFGFVSRYKNGASIPTGNTEFQFKTGSLNFSSTSYDWLVVAGAKAQYKGSGTVNGEAGYTFMLTATDGQGNGGGTDKFRIKIKHQLTGVVLYDNMVGADDEADPTTVLGGGSIVIHQS